MLIIMFEKMFRIPLRKQPTIRGSLILSGSRELYLEQLEFALQKRSRDYKLERLSGDHSNDGKEIDELLKNYMDVCFLLCTIQLVQKVDLLYLI